MHVPLLLKKARALHKASAYGHTEIVELLVGYGADIHAKNRHGVGMDI